jgi:copper transport protein
VKGPLDAGFGLSAVGRGSLLREVLGTTFGRATLVRLVAAVLGIGIVALWRRRRLQAPAAVLLALVVAASFAASGHAVAGIQRPVALVADSVHVLGASIWLGGLVLLLGWGLRAPAAADLARRFSRIALVVVCVVVATGLYQAWRQVGSVDALASTRYGRELGVKVLLVAVGVAAASISRSVVPRWSSDPSSVAVLRRSVLTEVLVLSAVLGVTSALVVTEPARTAYRPTVSSDLTIAGDTVQVWSVPDGERRVQVHLAVLGADGQPTEPQDLSATASLPANDIGPLPVPLTPAGTGHSVGEVQVPVAGVWRIAVTLGGESGDTQYVDVPIR